VTSFFVVLLPRCRNQGLNMFTIIGVAFIPLQFLTGYFG
jgi:Mg2+ and Co2+ transporter CorA